MRERPYRIGKKVGVFRFNVEKNVDELAEGKIVARRWHRTLRGDNSVGIDAEYVIKYKDGGYERARHDECWTKWGHEKDLCGGEE